MLIKWKLMLTTLPVVALVAGVKLTMERVFGFSGWVEFGDMSAVLTAGAFLIGFMLAGTMADFKESEKLPSELASTLETLEDYFTICEGKAGFDARAARASLLHLTNCCLDWLGKRAPVSSVFASLDDLSLQYKAMELAGAGAHANRSLVFVNGIRRIVGRIEVVSKTGFIASGYAILEVIVATIIVMLLASKFKSVVAEYVLMTFIPLVYIYMVRLIRDVDDPFEYDSTLARKGAAEVDLFPLIEYRDRAKARLARGGADGETPRAPNTPKAS